MNSIKRICISMNAHINSMIDQVENHEAVAEAALSEIRESMANAQYQLVRLQNEQKQMEARELALKALELKWKERAIQAGTGNHERAIECVRRLKGTQAEISSLAGALIEHRNLEKILVNDVRGIEEKFTELKRRRSLLAARESRAEALQSINKHENKIAVGGAFERWERSIMRAEIDTGKLAEPVDHLSLELSIEEEKLELESLLSELLTSENKVKS